MEEEEKKEVNTNGYHRKELIDFMMASMQGMRAKFGPNMFDAREIAIVAMSDAVAAIDEINKRFPPQPVGPYRTEK